jgi:hypothetical protein
VYLPVHYAETRSDSETEDINNDRVWLNLILRGYNKYSSVVLEIE